MYNRCKMIVTNTMHNKRLIKRILTVIITFKVFLAFGSLNSNPEVNVKTHTKRLIDSNLFKILNSNLYGEIYRFKLRDIIKTSKVKIP